MAVPAIVVEELVLPGDVQTFAGFRAWMASLPESGPRPRPTFCAAGVFVEMSPQDDETHEPLVRQINRRLSDLNDELGLGRYFFPASWITHERTKLSTEPDGFLVRWDALRSKRVRVNPRRRSELLGAPAWVLEVVSRSSVKKDLEALLDGYERAGVEEYWIVDAREEGPPTLAIHARGEDGLEARATGKDGWTASPFWGRAFRVVRGEDPAGWPTFTLEVRAARRRRER